MVANSIFLALGIATIIAGLVNAESELNALLTSLQTATFILGIDNNNRVFLCDIWVVTGAAIIVAALMGKRRP
jgi:hypothetical protein